MSDYQGIAVKRFSATSCMPTRAYMHDAGMDLYADLKLMN